VGSKAIRSQIATSAMQSEDREERERRDGVCDGLMCEGSSSSSFISCKAGKTSKMAVTQRRAARSFCYTTYHITKMRIKLQFRNLILND